MTTSLAGRHGSPIRMEIDVLDWVEIASYVRKCWTARWVILNLFTGRYRDACLIAEEYVLTLNVGGMRTGRDVARILVAEYMELHPHTTIDMGQLRKWLLTHRFPEPWRTRWRGSAMGLGPNELGEFMVCQVFTDGAPCPHYTPFPCRWGVSTGRIRRDFDVGQLRARAAFSPPLNATVDK